MDATTLYRSDLQVPVYIFESGLLVFGWDGCVTGQNIDRDRITWLGERIFNLEKCFNVLHTEWTRRDDMPPERFVSRALDGKFKLDAKAWEGMLDRYYDLHGWDKTTGKPVEETFVRINLGVMKTKLEQNGKLL